MDSLLDYFTSVAQIAIETQIENFLYKKLCEDKNIGTVLGKYNKSFTETTRIDELDKEQIKRDFKEKSNTDPTNVCHVSKKKIEYGANNEFKTYHITCKYCTKEFDAPNIKRRPNENNDYARNLCPDCNKPFATDYPCPNILVHSSILQQFNDVKMNKITWFSIRNINEKSGGRTRRKKRRHKWTRNRKKTNGKRAKSNKKRVQKKKPMKTRKYRPFILLSGGSNGDNGGNNDTPDPIEGKVKNAVVVSNAVRKWKNRFWNMPLYDEAMGLPDREKKFLEKNPHADAKDNMKNLRKLRAEQFKKQSDDEIEKNPNIRTQISKLKHSFEEKRKKAADQDSITKQLFNTDEDKGKKEGTSGSSSACCQQTPYNDFIKLISLIFNMSTEFIKDFFGLGDKEEGEDEGTKPDQSDILDKIMEILVSSIKLTLPDALGRAFKIHMTKLYMSKSNQSSMKEQIKLQTIPRIKDTYWASKIDGLQAKRNFIGSKKLSLIDN